MRGLALLLLIANVAFFGWRYSVEEEDRQADLRRHPPMPPGVPRLQVLPPAAPEAESQAAPLLERIEPVAASPGTQTASVVGEAASGQSQAADPSIPLQGSGVCVKNGPFQRRADADALIDWARPRVARLQLRQVPLAGMRRFALYLVPTVAANENSEDSARPGLGRSLEASLLLGVLDSQSDAALRATQVSRPGYRPLVVPRVDSRAQWFLEAELANGFEDVGEVPVGLVPGGKVQQVECAAL